MPKYLARVSYTKEGLKGLLKDGGSKRREVVEQLAKSLGGSLEAFYFAFGEDDVLMIVDYPDHVSVAAGSLIASSSGASKVTVTVLLTPEEIDQAAKMGGKYSPPGH